MFRRASRTEVVGPIRDTSRSRRAGRSRDSKSHQTTQDTRHTQADASRSSRESRDGEVKNLEATLARREKDLREQRAAVLELRASLEALVERHKTLRGALKGASGSVLKSLGAEPRPGLICDEPSLLTEGEPGGGDGTFLTNSVPYSPVRPAGLRPPDRVRTHKSPRVVGGKGS